MLRCLDVITLILAHILSVGAHSAFQHQNTPLVPYVQPAVGKGNGSSGIVILDNSNEGANMPFVEIYGAPAYHYGVPDDYHQNDFTRRQEALEEATHDQADAYDIMTNI